MKQYIIQAILSINCIEITECGKCTKTGGLWEGCPGVWLVTTSAGLRSEGPEEASAPLPGPALHSRSSANSHSRGARWSSDGEVVS